MIKVEFSKNVTTWCVIYSPHAHWLARLLVNTGVVSFWLFTASLHFAMATTFPPGLTGVFGTSLACYYCLSPLSITQITNMLIHMHGPRHYMQLLIGCRVWQCPCQPLFTAVTGDCSRLAHCWASFSWCKSAHVGHGDKYGPVGLELKQEKRVPHGLNCGLFWHTAHNSTLHQMPI